MYSVLGNVTFYWMYNLIAYSHFRFDDCVAPFGRLFYPDTGG